MIAIERLPESWMRFGIIILCIIGVVMLLIGIPIRYEALMQVCDGPECARRVLTTGDLAAVADMGWTQQGYALFQLATELTYLAVMGPLAVFLFRRRDSPQRHMPVLTAYILVALATILMPEITLALARSGNGWYLLYQVVKSVAMLGFFLFLFTFPDGRFVPGRLRWMLVVPAVSAGIWLVTGLPEWDQAERTGIMLTMAVLWTGVIAQIYRYRTTSSQEARQQTKWLLFGLLLVVIVNFVWVIAFQFLPQGEDDAAGSRVLFNTLGFLVLMTGPLSIAMALTFGILRYRLWDIDLLINRTLVYALLTVVVVVLYAAVVTVLSQVTRGDNTLPAFAAAGAIAVSFHTIRERIQRAINRLMFGQRDEPQAVLLELSNQLRAAVLPKDLLESSVNTVARTLRVPYVAIATQRGEAHSMQTAFGQDRTPKHAFPLIHQNEVVGELVVGQRSPGEPLNRADRAVLEGIAQQLGAVVYAVRLQADLQAARERLVLTREEERRRIRRDLHDGLGPALASLPLKIDAAIDLMEQERPTSVRLLDDVKRQSQQLVADVRSVVHDLRPPSLDELGLVEALRAGLAQLGAQSGGPTFSLDADRLPDVLSAAAEVATYRIALEAATNALKHANARHCWITLGVTGANRLAITIEDDGIGMPATIVPNVGLRSMRERAEELGGTFQIEAGGRGGTRIAGTIPLPERNHAP
ncbi:MAG: GAF domain-containing sensor histidine kinase [Chloroflexi bacterium]|nr:GAF domain-containing sensor histidine kinase [Chloroflexota bacterium]